MASKMLSKEQFNYTIYTRVCVDILKLPLIDILTIYIPPTDLYSKLSTSYLTSGKKKLRKSQLKICFFPLPLVPSYRNFDVSLLYTLIRNLCTSLIPPAQGWGKDPTKADTKIADDIERIRFFRNKFAHSKRSKISDSDFDEIWKILKPAMQRIQSHVKSLGLNPDYEQKLAAIERSNYEYEDFKKYKYFFEASVVFFNEMEERDNPERKRRASDDVFDDEPKLKRGASEYRPDQEDKFHTFYDAGESLVRFSNLFEDIARDFPPEKIYELKDLIQNSCKVKDENNSRLNDAVLARDCLRILREEKLFTPSDVIFVQYLLKKTDCTELFTKCVKYAERVKAWCFYEKPSDNGYTNVEFHIQGDIRHYNKGQIQSIINTVAVILDCNSEDIKLNGFRQSTSFVIILSIKDEYVKKLFTLDDIECNRLAAHAIDFVKIGESLVNLNRSEDRDLKTSNPKQMDSLSSQCSIRQCMRCLGDAAFYCATCYCGLCLQCKENHVTDLSSLDHDVRIYREKDRCNSEQQKCMKHHNIVCNWYCEDCEAPFCHSCNEHRTHKSIDVQQNKKAIRTIRSDILFSSCILLEDIKSDFTTYQTKITNCISDLQAYASKLKNRIDTAFCNFDFKHSCLEQKAEVKNRIRNFCEIEQKFEQLTSKPIQFLRFIKNCRLSKTQSYQRLKHHAHLSLTDPLCFEEIEESFCEITITEKGKRSVGFDSQLKLMHSPKLQTFLTLENVNSCCHVSTETSDRIWVSGKDYLVLTNTKGVQSYRLKTFNEFSGMHSINKDNDLIYIDDEYNIITLASNMKNKMTNTLIKSFEWKPKCLSYSRSTGDLLVGMYNKSKGEGKVIRFSQSGKQTQTIHQDNEGNQMYSSPSYIIENNNFDVVVSDTVWRTENNSSEESSTIVVTRREGEHRFSYTGFPRSQRIVSRGLCVDALSHIILCDNRTSTVIMLNCDGHFLSHLLIRPTGILKPHGLGYDFRTHLLWVGSHRNRICVYRYIKRRDMPTDSKSSDAIEPPNEFQITDTAQPSEINEEVINKPVLKEIVEARMLMTAVQEERNEEKMSESEETFEENTSVSQEDNASLMSLPVLENEDKKLINPPYGEVYRKVDHFYGCYHISCLTTDCVCISEEKDIILMNETGNTLHFKNYLPEFAINGMHTMVNEKELIYINSDYDIYRLSLDTETSKPLLQRNSAKWKPHCVYCSPFSRDLLVGMFRKDLKMGMVIRYSHIGELKQSIICDTFGQELYNEPRYITENRNGDVVVSDSDWESGAVVVTERGGKHRFTYTGCPPGSGLLPRGICTDSLSHIILCDSETKTIHIIDKDGRFLSNTFIYSEYMPEPTCLSYALSNDRLVVGSYNNNTIGVFRYLTEKINPILTEKKREKKREKRSNDGHQSTPGNHMPFYRLLK